MSTRNDQERAERMCRDAVRTLLKAGIDVSALLYIVGDAIGDDDSDGSSLRTIHQKGAIREVVRGAARFAACFENEGT